MISYTAPAAVRSALRKGLALVREGYAGKGLRGKTVEWAERLANGEPIDYAKAKKMRGWFARHGVPKKEAAARLRDPKSPASVAYLLWGGTPSIPFRKVGWQDPVAPWLRDVIARFENQRAGRRSQKNGAMLARPAVPRPITPRPPNILDAGLVDRIALIEGERFRDNDARSYARGDESSVEGVREAYIRGARSVAIYGSGGMHRYIVLRDGTVAFSKSHGRASVKTAEKLGFPLV